MHVNILNFNHITILGAVSLGEDLPALAYISIKVSNAGGIMADNQPADTCIQSDPGRLPCGGVIIFLRLVIKVIRICSLMIKHPDSFKP